MTTIFVDKFRVEITGKRYFYVYDLDDNNVLICLGLDKLIRFFISNGVSRYYIDKFIKLYDQHLIEVEKILHRYNERECGDLFSFIEETLFSS